MNDNLPLGAANDPRAPWNIPDVTVSNDHLSEVFEDAVSILVDWHSDASELKDMLSEALSEAIDNGACDTVDDAMHEATDHPAVEDSLYDMRKHIITEATSRIMENYILKLNK